MRELRVAVGMGRAAGAACQIPAATSIATAVVSCLITSRTQEFCPPWWDTGGGGRGAGWREDVLGRTTDLGILLPGSSGFYGKQNLDSHY